jgi:hypothetical protein
VRSIHVTIAIRSSSGPDLARAFIRSRRKKLSMAALSLAEPIRAADPFD